jgi:hypothetical protein
MRIDAATENVKADELSEKKINGPEGLRRINTWQGYIASGVQFTSHTKTACDYF